MPRNDDTRLSPDQARKIAEECYSEVLAYCRRHAPAGHEPADLAQETFLRFVRAQGYRERGKPIAYLMRIARSVCVDASRERRGRKPVDHHAPVALDRIRDACRYVKRYQCRWKYILSFHATHLHSPVIENRSPSF